MKHQFNLCLQYSHEAEEFPEWEQCYRYFFPSMVCMESHRHDMYNQLKGIDRSVRLKDGRVFRIDEKVRRKDYEDIALEVWSDVERQKPGWISKPIEADYIAYMIHPRHKCFLLPVIPLQAAWSKWGEDWSRIYFHPKAPNDGYYTESVAIPLDVLFAAIGKQLRYEW